MILLGLGSNLQGPWGTPAETFERALVALREARVLQIVKSRWVISSPLGRSSQPNYLNGVVRVETHMPPRVLLAVCHKIERRAQRKRGAKWTARTLDIDLLDYRGLVIGGRGPHKRSIRSSLRPIALPHPEIANRPFVLEPLHEIAPRWHHPINGLTAWQMLQRLPRGTQGGIIK